MLDAAILLLTLISVASAQICPSQYKWMENASLEDPCTVANHLNSPCLEGPRGSSSGGVAQNHSTYPRTQAPSPCVCNTIYYNLAQACSMCRNRPIITWSEWQMGCPEKNVITYPKFENKNPVVEVPQWAYQNVLVSNAFNPSLALQTSGKGVPPDPPSTTRTSLSPNALAAAIASPITGVVVLGVIVLLYFRYRRRSKGSRGASEEISSAGETVGAFGDFVNAANGDDTANEQEGLLNPGEEKPKNTLQNITSIFHSLTKILKVLSGNPPN